MADRDDIIGLLTRDHRALRTLAGQLDYTENPEELERIAHRILTEFSVHEAMEHDVVFPALLAVSGDAEPETRRRLGEHEEISALLTALQVLDPRGPGFLKRACALVLQLEAHLDVEEELLLPWLEASFTPDELAHLADEVRAATRPLAAAAAANGRRVQDTIEELRSPRERGHEVLANVELSPGIHKLEVRAPRIACTRRPGQFVIVRLGPGGERIPLTIADADRARESITLIIQAIGKSTRDLTALVPGERIADVAGPLGCPTHLLDKGRAVCVGGGVGSAVVYPIAQALRNRGVKVTTILGARSEDRLLLQDDFARLGDVEICTDDGSVGRQGTVTAALADLLLTDRPDIVYAVGPVPMMHAVVECTRPFKVHTIVSLNPIMVDGTGMCGGCRVTVNGETRFACVDGPEFDGHEVDFTELADRLTAYRTEEQHALAAHGHR